MTPPPGGALPALNPGVRRREVFGWAMYDFANSGYTTVVLTAVFNAYFVSTVAGGKDWATLAWTVTLGVSYAIVMVAGPVVGAWADAHAAKKRSLLVSTIGCVAGTAALALVGPGDVALACALLVVSNVAYSMGENLTASFLPELARPSAVGKVSGWGWSLGYVGGLLALGLGLAWVMGAPARGATTAEAVPGTMLITAAVFALASVFTFALMKERAVPVAASEAASHALARLARTAREALAYRDLLAVFACGTFYQAGVATVIALAAIYAEQVMGFQTQDTILLILAVNVTAGLGAFGFGYVQDRLGKVPALRITLWAWLVMILVAWGSTTTAQFWVAANLAGLAMGSSQSAGRALVAYFAPPSRTGEFFGLWGAATRLASILGPVTYGLVTWITGGNHRLAIACTGIFFLAALGLLALVNESRGREAAVAA